MGTVRSYSKVYISGVSHRRSVDYLKQWLCVVCPTMPSVPDNMGNQFASGICGTDAHIDEVLFLFWLEDSK